MNNKSLNWIKYMLYLFGLLTVALPAQAASFDCAKAGTKIEHMICDSPEISKLDEELSAVYKAALEDGKQADAIKQAQRQWTKERNKCSDTECVKFAYRNRIGKLTSASNSAEATAQAKTASRMSQQKASSPNSSNTESYTLLMSKDDELCNLMRQEFNSDLRKYGWNGDKHQEEHEEFKRVPWKPARFSSVINGRTEYTDVEGALFDFNNDGVQDFVVRWKATLSGMRADTLDVFDASVSKHANDLVAKDIGGGDNTIYLAGWWYNLSPPFGAIAGVRVLEPFIYHDTSYLVMRPLFEELRTKGGYAVIAKYGSGKFVNREMTGKMEDMCYFKRIGAKRKN